MLRHHLAQTWRSILSVILAYVIVVLLFLYESSWLNMFVEWGATARVWLKDVIGRFSQRGETLFAFTISDFTTFMTLMILFVRVVVISLALWISDVFVKGLLGRG